MKRLLAALLAICLLTTCAFAEGGEGQPPAPPVETPQPAAAPPAEAPKPPTEAPKPAMEAPKPHGSAEPPTEAATEAPKPPPRPQSAGRRAAGGSGKRGNAAVRAARTERNT